MKLEGEIPLELMVEGSSKAISKSWVSRGRSEDAVRVQELLGSRVR